VYDNGINYIGGFVLLIERANTPRSLFQQR